MHLVAKLQGLGYRKRIEKELRDVDQRLQLPVEILEQILLYLPFKDRKTLFSLYSASRTFRTIVAPALYRCIDLIIDLQILHKMVQLPKMLSHPNLISYTTELNLTLFDGQILRSTGLRVPYATSMRQCRRLEEMAGKVATRFPNLKQLKLDCELHGGHIQTLEFLERLSTRKLKVLDVRCRCTGVNIDLVKISAAPCMQTVTSIGWTLFRSRENRPLDRTTESSTNFPNLSRIGIDHSRALTDILYSRRMNRMDFRFFDSDAERLVRHHAQNITHLNILGSPGWIFFQEIAPHLKRIRFLGRLITYGMPPTELYVHLETIQCLGPTLQFLYTDIDPHFLAYSSLIPRIENLFPNLRIILPSKGSGLIRRDDIGDWISWDKVRFDPDRWQILEDEFESFLQNIPSRMGEGITLLRHWE